MSKDELMLSSWLPLDSESKSRKVEKVEEAYDFRAAKGKHKKMVALHLLGSGTSPNLA